MQVSIHDVATTSTGIKWNLKKTFLHNEEKPHVCLLSTSLSVRHSHFILLSLYSSDSEHDRSLNCFRYICFKMPHIVFLSVLLGNSLLLKIDWYKDRCYWKHICGVGRSLSLSIVCVQCEHSWHKTHLGFAASCRQKTWQVFLTCHCHCVIAKLKIFFTRSAWCILGKQQQKKLQFSVWITVLLLLVLDSKSSLFSGKWVC